jgi:hypothetical protein
VGFEHVAATDLPHNHDLDHVANDIVWLAMISLITVVQGEYSLQL